MSLHWSQCNFIVVDVEGNGHHPQEIIELAIVPIRQGRIVDTQYEWLIQPIKPVTRQASRLHGIFDIDLSGKPKFDEISFDIASVLGSEAVIGHNVAVDVQLLKDKLPLWKPEVAIDTLKLAKLAIPSAGSYALNALASTLGIGSVPYRKSHRAASDAMTTAQLFLALASALDKRGELDLHTLAEMAASAKDPFFKITQQNLF